MVWIIGIPHCYLGGYPIESQTTAPQTKNSLDEEKSESFFFFANSTLYQ